MIPDLRACPRLAPGVRLNEKNQHERMLLMPERALKLNGPSLEIVTRCDGQPHGGTDRAGFAQTLCQSGTGAHN